MDVSNGPPDGGGAMQENGGPRERKRARRTSTIVVATRNVDISQNHSRAPMMIPGRESHTSDLELFDTFVEKLKTVERDVDEPFEPKFWSFIRSVLEQATPTGFDALPSSSLVSPKGPEDLNAFITKFKTLGMVNPIYPAAVSEASGVPLHTCLTELLYAARKTGLVTLKFAPECSRCGAAACLDDRLGNLPSRTKCVACGYGSVEIDAVDKIKVLFTLDQEVLYVPADNLGCPPVAASMAMTDIFAPVPATYTGSGFSYSSGCESKDGSKAMICPALTPGKYRVRCPISSTDGYLVIERQALADDKPINLELRVSDMLIADGDGASGPASFKTITVPHGKIRFEVLPDTRSFSILWIQKDQDEDTMLRLPEDQRVKFASAAHVIHHPVFQLLFRSQVVNDGGTLTPHGAALTLSRVVLVFTDVVGSTQLYGSVGDGNALRLVRSHYEVLFGAFTKRGRVVKTIGDAVMAAFTSGRDALFAVATALRELQGKNLTNPRTGLPFQIRIGVHAGPAVVVPLNGINDYFGQTVNIAARVEGAARPGECLITETSLKDDPGTMAAFEELLGMDDVVVSANDGTELTLKGILEPVKARGFRIQK